MRNLEVEQITERLKYLDLAPLPLIGCPRRNRWSGRAWRSDVGAAVMAMLGQKMRVHWEGGVADVFISAAGTPMMWRGGPWRDWWVEDATVLAGMIRAHAGLDARGVVVLHELDGRTQVRYIAIPVRDSERSFDASNAAWEEGGEDAPPRLQRRSARAAIVCPRCPVRQRCEAIDRERGDTQDWE